MNDSNFHIVKNNGQLEIVKLEPVKKKPKPKLNLGVDRLCPTEDRKCNGDISGTSIVQDTPAIGKCSPELHSNAFPKYVSTKLTDFEEVTPKKAALKTYSRVRKRVNKSNHICLNGLTPKEAILAIHNSTVGVPHNSTDDVPYNSTVDVPDVKPDQITLKKEAEVEETTVDVPDVKPVLFSPEEYEEIHAVKATTVDVLVQIPPEKVEECHDPIAIKTEPDLDIVDEEPEAVKEIMDNSKQSLVSMEENVVSENKSIKAVRKVKKLTVSRADVDQNVINLSTIPNLLQLSKRTVKCNVCGMIFPKSANQVRTLGRHFLKHKTSVVTVVTKFTDFTIYGQYKGPVILNNSVVKTYASPGDKSKKESSPMETPYSSGGMRRRKLNDIEPVPHDILHRLRSCQSKKKDGKSHVLIGSTLIKPMTQSTSVSPVNRGPECSPESKESHGMDALDADDDVEILEEKPELIVIDDNDDDVLDTPNEDVEKSI
ncbi:uncharacterized protein LOC119083353 [Bradysia coprophila]|uniref:uncharacterized protein LOC119083353 n=1 Tax=Bradysia coprophila TaxID=38358 RepID=UPI00187D7537|nr:uncharacterized protein LOC119083353 [Bradysia coprophila]